MNSSILIISYSYKPLNTPRAFRWSAIAEYWVKQGHRVDVVCAWKPGLLESEILNGVHVYRIGGETTESLRNRFAIRKQYGKKVQGNKEASTGISLRHKAGHFVKWIHDRTWKKVYWPDYACLWYFPAAKKAMQLVVKNQHDRLISVSHPFTGHLIGLKLKKKYPQIKWLVDIGDPFCFLEETPTNNFRLYRELNYRYEEKVFNNADAVSVTTHGTLEKYSEIFPEVAQKIYVIPPLLPYLDNLLKEQPIFSGDQEIRLAFFGTLYRTIRNPAFLLRLFYDLLQTRVGDKLELHFFGNTHDCNESFAEYSELINDRIFFHGRINREKALCAMKQADILVNLGNNTSYQLPSKVVEYVSTGNPVLNIAKSQNDSSVAFFSKYPASFCIFEDNGGLSSAGFDNLLRFIEHSPLVEPAALQSWVSRFHVEAIAKSYEGFFK